MKTISIITNKAVDFTFESKPCLLRRTISKETITNGISRYEIVTDRCNYEETSTPITEQVEILDVDGNPTGNFESQPVLDEEGNPTFNVVTKIVSYGQKDKTGSKVVNAAQADALFNLISGAVTLDNGYSEFLHSVKLLSLLGGTQQDLPYGTKAEDWIILE